MRTISTDLTSIANELSIANPRLSIHLRTLSIEAWRMERTLDEIIGDAAENERIRAAVLTGEAPSNVVPLAFMRVRGRSGQ